MGVSFILPQLLQLNIKTILVIMDGSRGIFAKKQIDNYEKAFKQSVTLNYFIVANLNFLRYFTIIKLVIEPAY